MNPSGGFTSQLSPDACQTAIDTVAWETYQRKQATDYVSATNPFFFKQDRTQLMAETWDEYSNVGPFEKMDEQEEFANSDAFLGNTKTVRQQKYGKQVPVSMEAFLTDKVGLRTRLGTDIGTKAQIAQDKGTILDTYAEAFATTNQTTPDGAALASNSHTTLKGFTVDNLETAALDADGLWTVVQSLANQKAQDGEAGSYVFEGILVPYILTKTVHETLDSELIPFSGENQINVFNTILGSGISIGSSIFLGSTYNSNTNANTSYHVLSSSHQVTRQVMNDLSMTLIPPENTANDSYIHRSRFWESHFPRTWSGYVGSNGTA